MSKLITLRPPSRSKSTPTSPSSGSPAPDEPVEERCVGIISMPWMGVGMPSIQLATLAAALEQEGIQSQCFELYLDYAALIGTNLYNQLSNLPGFSCEWIFARHYYEAELGVQLPRPQDRLLALGLDSTELEERALQALHPVTEEFLRRCLAQLDLERLDVIGFSLTISQVASSMALARLIKRAKPEVSIVFGGAGCAGPMGPALMRICPYIDAVVQVEGEPVFGELIRRFRAGRSAEGIPGTCWRDGAELRVNDGSQLYTGRAQRPPINYDAYFERLDRLGLRDRLPAIWLPYESSRGCWYGQKRQCTFCGLHDIMKYRSWTYDVVLDELEHLRERYGTSNFFAVDLILPRDFTRNFFPELIRRDHDWRFFYEIKANMKRAELEVMADAGVCRVQPGIESLDDELLDLMRKGVSALQNVLLLKWCEELGIYASWNIIRGLPGESEAAYERMVALIAKLHHLRPPSGAGAFQLHRFSPYFNEPDRFGIQGNRAHSLFHHVFPVDQEVLDDLVYIHEYDLDAPIAGKDLVTRLEQAIADWKQAYARGARLSLLVEDGGEGVVEDHRDPASPRTVRLSPEQVALYQALERPQREDRLVKQLAEHHPGLTVKRIADTVEAWVREGFVVRDGKRVMALATLEANTRRSKRGAQPHAPLPYLE